MLLVTFDFLNGLICLHLEDWRVAVRLLGGG